MEHTEKLFERAIALRDSGKPHEAIGILEELVNLEPKNPKTAGIYTVLAGILYNLGDYKKAEELFRIATSLKSGSELASLGLYLCLLEHKRFDEAVAELERYLTKHPANLYRDTLIEIMQDIDDGYAQKYKERILSLARLNSLI